MTTGSVSFEYEIMGKALDVRVYLTREYDTPSRIPGFGCVSEYDCSWEVDEIDVIDNEGEDMSKDVEEIFLLYEGKLVSLLNILIAMATDGREIEYGE